MTWFYKPNSRRAIQTNSPARHNTEACSHSDSIRNWACVITACIAWAMPSQVFADTLNENKYAEMDLEELMSIQVDSVAGVDKGWFGTPAAMWVIDNNDIVTSGHQSLAELLRDVPGMHVAQINSHEWGVGARGFNYQLVNKLQVVIDGREVYDPIFAGVRWKHQDMILDDIEQIEVIRGPGATLWGANAMNGVINVKTKSAEDTQGLYIKQVVGTELHDITSMRYGGKLGDDTFYRVWGKYTDVDAGTPAAGIDEFDDTNLALGGFRIDRNGADDTDIMFQGQWYNSDRFGDRMTIPGTIPFTLDSVSGDYRMNGGSLTTQIKHDGQDGSGWSLTGYVDYFTRSYVVGLDEANFSTGLDMRQYFNLGDRHAVIWGLGHRLVRYDYDSTGPIDFDPSEDTLQVVSAFLQDTITLKPDQWFLMLGSKFEHNEFSGFEVQPSARLWWTPNDHQTLWAAVSRPIRRPNVLEERVNVELFNTIFPAPNDVGRLVGANNQPETMTAWELGYRHRFGDTMTIDLASFYNQYQRLVVHVPDGLGYALANSSSADSYGLETAVQWRPGDNLRMTASHTAFFVESRGIDNGYIEGRSPRYQFKLRSDYDLTDSLALNTEVYYVDHLGLDVPEYWRVDTGVTWKINANTDLSVWGQNLFDDHHTEFISLPQITTISDVDRGVYMQLRCRF